MEQEFIATNKKYCVSNKFQRKRYNIYNNNLLLQACETTRPMQMTMLVVGVVVTMARDNS